jgi:hypothetical protein
VKALSECVAFAGFLHVCPILGIDGYSRLPVYLRCSANNKADTVLRYFLEAVQEFGVPSRVRGDRVATAGTFRRLFM